MINCIFGNSCETSGHKDAFPAKTPLAMCYVPYQEIGDLYPENTAFEKGTVFPELYFPFKGKGSDMNG